MEKQKKVIGIGFHKTGTTTLGDCLRILGYCHISCSERAFKFFYKGNFEKVFNIMEKYDSFEDWPWPLMFREIYKRFPDSKFILTRRTNEEVWFKSLVKHIDRGAGTGFKYRKYIYGYENPSEHKELYIKKYLSHNDEVRNFFSDKKDQFIEVCWEEGDSWNKLCNFLGEMAPTKDLPHSNSHLDTYNVSITKIIKNFYYSIFSLDK